MEETWGHMLVTSFRCFFFRKNIRRYFSKITQSITKCSLCIGKNERFHFNSEIYKTTRPFECHYPELKIQIAVFYSAHQYATETKVSTLSDNVFIIRIAVVQSMHFNHNIFYLTPKNPNPYRLILTSSCSHLSLRTCVVHLSVERLRCGSLNHTSSSHRCACHVDIHTWTAHALHCRSLVFLGLYYYPILFYYYFIKRAYDLCYFLHRLRLIT